MRPGDRLRSAQITTLLLCPLGLLAGCGKPPLPLPAGEIPEPPAAGEVSPPGNETGCATPCGELCVDLATDPRNCGACGTACSPAQVCKAGMCRDMDGGSMMTPAIRCNEDPPPGAVLPPPPPRYSGGACPNLVPGKNILKSSGNDRSFLLVLPRDLRQDEKLPLIFMWHWLGGSAEKFRDRGQVQAAADSQRFMAILPESKGDMLFRWPFDIGVTAARQEEEYRFFDDMYACAAAKYKVNRNCVSSVGVSAGALFTAQLAGGRGHYLSSAISLSGGTGGGVIKPFGNPAHRMPFLVLWGGPLDLCIVLNFDELSRDLEKALTARGHFLVECIHNCRHAEPPLTGLPGLSKYSGLWKFVFDHPYWLGAGESPYRGAGLPAGFPEFCGIGMGSAKIRTGECPDKPGC